MTHFTAVTNLITFSYVLLRTPTSHSSLAFSVSAGFSQWCANSHWQTKQSEKPETIFIQFSRSVCRRWCGLYHLYASWMLSSFTVLIFCGCCFCSLLSYLSTWITPVFKESDRIACMRCLLSNSVNFCLLPYIIMCTGARNGSEQNNDAN